MSDGPRGEDIVEQGGPGPGRRFRRPDRLRPSRGAGVLAALTLVVGLAAGYAAGNHQARGGAALPEPTRTASTSAAATPTASRSAAAVPAASLAFIYPFIQDTGACSVQSGRRLALGVQFTNQSTVPLTLTSAKAVLPLGGLTPGTWHWMPCGALPGTFAQAEAILLPGASTWLTMTFIVKVGCPAPLPVQFAVGYSAQGRSATESLPGFPDLGQVPYTGCPPVSPG